MPTPFPHFTRGNKLDGEAYPSNRTDNILFSHLKFESTIITIIEGQIVIGSYAKSKRNGAARIGITDFLAYSDTGCSDIVWLL